MERYSRQTIFPKIGKKGQKKLLESSVLIIGVGALGTNVSNYVARAGFGTIKLVDRDYIELNNLQRQILFDENDIGKYKARIACEKLKKINSFINVEAKVVDVNYKNIEDLIKDVDIVLDGTDNVETRLVINDACVKNRKPWIYGGVIGSIGVSMSIFPEGPCFRCFVKKIPAPGSLQTCDTAGVLNTIPSIIAAYETTEAMKILLGDENVSKDMVYIDVWDRTFNKLKVKKDKDCACCIKEDFEFLTSKHSYQITSLCGSNAVQIVPPGNEAVDIKSLEKKLKKVGTVRSAGDILEFEVDDYRFTVFFNGSAIIRYKKTDKIFSQDHDLAKSLYVKYIGR